MARVCAWCKKVMDPSELETGFDTHGICPDCEDKLYEEEGWDKEKIKRKEVMV